MKLFDNEDYETPIEYYPGFIGYTWDGEFFPGEALTALSSFDWNGYSELVEEAGGSRQITVHLPRGPLTIKFEAYDDIAYMLDQFPSVKVYRDNGPPDAGPASGAGYIFLTA